MCYTTMCSVFMLGMLHIEKRNVKIIHMAAAEKQRG